MNKKWILMIALLASSQSLAHMCDPAEQDKETGFYGSFLQLDGRQVLQYPNDKAYSSTEKQLLGLRKDCPNLQDPPALRIFDNKFLSKCNDSCHDLSIGANKDDTFFKNDKTSGTEYECKKACEIAYFKSEAYTAGRFRGQALCTEKSTAKRPAGNVGHLCDNSASLDAGFATVYDSLGHRLNRYYDYDIGANVESRLKSLHTDCPNLKDPDAMLAFNQKYSEKCDSVCHSVVTNAFKDETETPSKGSLARGNINAAESGCKTACLINQVENQDYAIGLREGYTACRGTGKGPQTSVKANGDR